MYVNGDGKYMLNSQPAWLSFWVRQRAIDYDLVEICRDLIEIVRDIIVTNHIAEGTGYDQTEIHCDANIGNDISQNWSRLIKYVVMHFCRIVL